VPVKNLFPRILRLALEALANEKRQLIVSYLLTRREASVSDLERALGVEGNDIAYHIKKLVYSNIVERRVREYSVVYRLTPFAIELLLSLFKALEPSRGSAGERGSLESSIYYTVLDESMGSIYDIRTDTGRDLEGMTIESG